MVVQENAEYFSTVFEIGRRHKILNPECMRTGERVYSLVLLNLTLGPQNYQFGFPFPTRVRFGEILKLFWVSGFAWSNC